jgi:hypothetical protein
MIKLNAVHLIEDDVYLIKQTYIFPRLQISGRIVETPGLFVVSNLDEVKVVITPTPKIIHYMNKNTGEILNLENYTETLELLESKSDEDGIFSDLDEEYAYKKFQQEWIPIKEKQPDYILEQVEFEITEVRKNSGDPDIISLWNSPNVINKNKAYFILNRLAVAKKILTQLCAENQLELEIPNHSGLTYAKINGTYMFDKSYEYNNSEYIETLEGCKNEKEKIYKRIKERVDIVLLKSVKLLSIGEVLLDLENISSALNGYKVSKNDLERARTSLRNLKKKVRSQVE